MLPVEDYLQQLSACLGEDSSEHDAKRFGQLLKDLFSYFKSPMSDLDLSLSFLMDSNGGILPLLKKVRRNEKFRQCVSLAFKEIHETVLKNHKNKQSVKPYILDLEDFCMQCVKEDVQQSDSKEAALKILIECLPLKIHGEAQLQKLLDHITQWLCSTLSGTVLKQVYILLGKLGKDYYELFSNDSARFFNQFIYKLEQSLLILNDAGVPGIIEGCFEGLTSYMDNAAIPDESINGKGRLYKVTQKTCEFNPDASRKVYQRAALNLVAKHCQLMKELIMVDYQWWFDNLRKWLTLNTNRDNQKVASEALIEICNVVAKELEDNDVTDGREMLKYFMNEIRIGNDVSTSSYLGSELSIRLLGTFATPCHKYHVGDDITKLFMTTVERVQLLCLEKNRSELEQVHGYLECLARLSRAEEKIPHQQLIALQTLSVMLMKLYPELSAGSRFRSVCAIQATILCLSFKSEKTLDSFLEVVIFQGIIRTCDNLIFQDVEFQKSLNVEAVSYKDYLKMWEDLFKVTRTAHQVTFLEIPFSRLCWLEKKLYSQLIDSSLQIIAKLDLSTICKEDEDKDHAPENNLKSYYNAKTPKDFTILVNLIDFLKDLLSELHKFPSTSTLFTKHFPRFCKEMIKYSVQYPLVSSFYKIIASALQISDEKYYFKRGNSPESIEHKNFCLLIQSYLESVLTKAQEFTDELQISCLHVIMAAPTIFIEHVLPLISSFLQVAFRVGSSYLPLANVALSTLERWIDAFPPVKINPSLKEILPCLDSFLRSKDYEGDPEAVGKAEAELKQLTSGPKKSKRKVKKQHEIPDTELFLLQKKIVMLLGKVNMSTALTLLNSDDSRSKWKSTRQLKCSLPFPDCKLVLYLDEFLPRIVESATSSSDRKTKVAASELLHAAVLVLLGNNVLTCTSSKNETADVLEELMPALLQLGCDSDNVVKQLFESLVEQLIRYFSSKFEVNSKSSSIVLEALMDGITNPIDSSVRDFSAKCVKVFVSGSIRQFARNDKSAPMNVRVVISRLKLYCIHPSKFKRLGGAMIFNSIYRDLREERSIIDEYWLELMYYLIKNLSLSEENNDCSYQVKNALRHILRVAKDDNIKRLLNGRNDKRRKPTEFKDETMRSAVIWLLQQAASPSVACRTEAKLLFQNFAGCLPGFISATNFISSMLSIHGDNFVRELADSNFTSQPPYNSSSPYSGVIEWLKKLHAALDFYSWLFGDMDIEQKILSQGNSNSIEAMAYFIKHVSSTTFQCLIESLDPSWSTEVPQLVQSLYSNVATSVLIQLLKFLTICQYSYKKETFLRKLLTESLWELLTLCILKPSRTVIRGVCSEESLQLKTIVTELLCVLDKKLPSNLLTDFLKVIEKEVDVIHRNLLEQPLGHQLLQQVSNNEVVEGLILLQECGLLKKVLKSNLIKSSSLYQKIFDSLFNENDSTVPLEEEESSYLRSLFTLSTLLSEGVEDLFLFISNSRMVKTDKSLKPTSKGEHFLRQFFDQIVSHLFQSFQSTIDLLITPNNVHVDILLAILKEHEYSAKEFQNRDPTNLPQLRSCIYQRWNVLEKEAEKYDNQGMRISNILNILLGIVKTHKIRVGCLRTSGTLDVVRWLMRLLNRDVEKAVKLIVLDFLVAVLDPSAPDPSFDDVIEAELRSFATEIYFPSESRYSPQYIFIQTCLHKILTGLEQTGSPVLLNRVMRRTTSDLNKQCLNRILKTLEILFKKQNDAVRSELLKTMYEFVVDESNSNTSRLNSLIRYLEPALRYCCLKRARPVLVSFYAKHIGFLISILEKDFSKGASIDKIEQELITKILASTLVEIMFGYFERSEFDNEWLTKASSENKPLPKMLAALKSPKPCIVLLDTAEGKDLLRKYFCANFNATVALLCNSKRTPTLDPKKALPSYEKFIFEKLGCKDHMGKIIDLNRSYSFNIDFDEEELPKQTKTLVSIRRAVRAEEALALNRSFQESNYLSSESSSTGSLSEDLTKYDFSNYHVVETHVQEGTPEEIAVDAVESECLELEMDTINEHECMPMLTALINTMVDSKIIEPPATVDGTPKLPIWMDYINKTINDSSVHANIRVFLCKLILNVEGRKTKVFEPYAAHFISSISKTIQDKCCGDEINYFVADLVTLLLSWRSVAIPKKDCFQTTELLEFLMGKTWNANRKVFKRNLELLKTVIEAWKSVVELPYQELYNLLMPLDRNSDSSTPETGINIAGILLFNGLLPFSPSSTLLKKQYLQALLMHLETKSKVAVYEPTAEVIGLLLRSLQGNEETPADPKYSSFFDHVEQILTKIFNSDAKNNDKFFRSLQKICIGFPDIALRFSKMLVSRFKQISPLRLDKCIDILTICANTSCDSLYNEITRTQIFDDLVSHMKSSGSQCQLPALRLISSMILQNRLSDEHRIFVISSFLNLVSSESGGQGKSREIIFTTVKKLYGVYLNNQFLDKDIKEKCKEVLLLGLVDRDANIQSACYEFWTKEAQLPQNAIDRLKFVITELYLKDIEYAYLGYCLRFILECASQTSLEEAMFPEPLHGIKDFKVKNINTAWKAQHSSFVPLFANTSQSLSMSQSRDDDPYQIRATPQSAEFSLTQPTAGPSRTSDDSFGSTSFTSEVSSSFVFASSTEMKTRSFTKKFRKPESPSDASYAASVISSQHKSQRLRKSKTNDFYYAQENVKLNRAIEIMQKEEIQKRKKEITILRNYRDGEFPDIQIKYSELIVPLRVFAERDQSTARQLMVALFKSFCGEINKMESAESFYAELSHSISGIMKESLTFNSAVIGSFLEISYYCHDEISIDFETASNASIASGLMSLGTLVLENQFLNSSPAPPPAKRQRHDDNEDGREIWFKLAELYQCLGESDVVLGIFRNKLAQENKLLSQAIEAEQLEDWQSARKNYFRVYEEQQSQDFSHSDNQQSFVEQSFFKSTANCSQWDSLHKSVLSALSGDYDSIWDEQKKVYRLRSILPWLFSSELHMLLMGAKTEFPTKIEDWIKDESRKEELLSCVGEHLSVWGAIRGSVERSHHFSKLSLFLLLNSWANLNPLSHQLRSKKLLDFHTLSEVMNILSTVNNGVTLTKKIEAIQKDWKKNPPAVNDSLTHWDTRLLYRCLLNQSQWNGVEKNLITSLKQTLLDTRLGLIDVTLKGKNYQFAKYQLSKIKRDDLSEPLCELYNSKILLKNARLQPRGDAKAKTLIKSWDKLGLKQDNNLSCSLSFMRFLLMADLSSEFTDIIAHVSADQRNKIQQSLTGEFYKRNFLFNQPLEDNLKKLGFECLSEAVGEAERNNDAGKDSLLAEAHMKIVRFCFGVYSRTEDVPEDYNEHFVRSLLSAMKYGSSEAVQLFPCLLQLPSLETNSISQLFKSQCTDVPEWKFLEWVPQLLTALFTPKVNAVSKLLISLAEIYPKALIYPFQLSMDMHSDLTPDTEAVVKRLKSLLAVDVVTHKFIEAVSCVCVPDIKLKWFMDRILSSLEKNDGKADHYLKSLLKLYDVTEIQGDIIKTISSSKQTVNKIKNLVDKGKLDEACKEIRGFLSSDTFRKYNKETRDFRLNYYSPWLSSFSLSSHSSAIEIPGQYSNKLRPDPKNHVMIADFKSTVQVMASIRKPIKLTVIGNDGNDYSFLVKFGEDLRQDQRIQQLLTLMNTNLTSNCRTVARNLTVARYSVIPLSPSVGLIQWIDNTVPLKELMLKPLSDAEREAYQSLPNSHRTWINSAVRRNRPKNSNSFGEAAQTFSRKDVVMKFDQLAHHLPLDVLKKSLLSHSINLESFISMRNEFLSSFAVMSVCHWLLGIGDRHLSNTLVDRFNGRCLGIDFGHAFGTATQCLPVPELMPFRATPRILNLTEPFSRFGLLRETMVYTLKCQKENNHILLATMQVFIEEPSMDWFEHAHKLAKKQEKEDVNILHLPDYLKDAYESFSRRNIQFARRKLEGGHPTQITIQELQAGHSRSPYLSSYESILYDKSSLRSKFQMDQCLTENQQVDILLDQAEDKQILGLTWSGWEPWM